MLPLAFYNGQFDYIEMIYYDSLFYLFDFTDKITNFQVTYGCVIYVVFTKYKRYLNNLRLPNIDLN